MMVDKMLAREISKLKDATEYQRTQILERCSEFIAEVSATNPICDIHSISVDEVSSEYVTGKYKRYEVTVTFKRKGSSLCVTSSSRDDAYSFFSRVLYLGKENTQEEDEDEPCLAKSDVQTDIYDLVAPFGLSSLESAEVKNWINHNVEIIYSGGYPITGAHFDVKNIDVWNRVAVLTITVRIDGVNGPEYRNHTSYKTMPSPECSLSNYYRGKETPRVMRIFESMFKEFDDHIGRYHPVPISPDQLEMLGFNPSRTIGVQYFDGLNRKGMVIRDVSADSQKDFNI